jgi:hypothetical protein
MSSKAKLLTIVGALIVICAVIGGALYYAFPVQVSTYAALTRNYLISLGAPAGAVTTELNSVYEKAAAAAPSPPPRRHRRAPPPETGQATTELSLPSVTRRSARSIRRMSGS